jgi:hypothetical protein
MSDFLAGLVRRARGESPQVRPVSRLYGEPDEAVELVEEGEYGEEAAPTRAAGPRPKVVGSVRPEATPPTEATQAQVRAEPEPMRARVDPPQQVALPTERTSEPAQTTADREWAPPARPTPRPDEQPRPRARRKRSPRVEAPSAEPTASVRDVVVERPTEAGPSEDYDVRPAPVRPAEPQRRAALPQPKPARRRIEPDLPSPPIREQIVFTPSAAPEPPLIHVTIGRVELRAPAPSPRSSPVELARPKQSLDDYLVARERRRA